MCGIVGVFNLTGSPVANDLLQQMAQALAHRGPDGQGVFVDEAIGLAHRRLAIIDLSTAAQQPMFSADKRYVLTYNGEIYNYRELREQLQKLGHRFYTQSDSEVILNAYIQWNADCVTHFNGMFAFAIWDKQDKTLFLARDRYGIKPLYYAFVGNTFIFASEQKALLTYPNIKRQLDRPALLEYFTFQNIFTDKTLIDGIKLFPAGHVASLRLGDKINHLPLMQYWDFHFAEPDTPLSDQEYLEELNRLFSQAVTRQLVSDVDVGSYLSGGMDSGSITAIAAKHNPYMKTFTCGFDLRSASGLELGFDEREQAEYMSYLFKTEHYEMVLKAGDMERVLPQLAFHLEEPRVGQSYPNFCIAKLAAKFVKVVLSGTGGDELFAGYPWRYYRSANVNNFSDYLTDYYQFWQRLLLESELRDVFAPIWSEVNHVQPQAIFKSVFSKHANTLHSPEEYINHSLYFEAKTFLHGLLVVEDKLSMAYGLETRLPFLDNDLVDFAMQLPTRLKLKDAGQSLRLNENEPGPKSNKYFEQYHDGKLILRKAMEKYIPQQVTAAKKQGFSAPDASWFKGESIEYVRKTLLDDQAKIYEYFDKKITQQLVQQHLEGQQNRRLFIWSLLNFNQYLQNYS